MTKLTLFLIVLVILSIFIGPTLVIKLIVFTRFFVIFLSFLNLLDKAFFCKLTGQSVDIPAVYPRNLQQTQNFKYFISHLFIKSPIQVPMVVSLKLREFFYGDPVQKLDWKYKILALSVLYVIILMLGVIWPVLATLLAYSLTMLSYLAHKLSNYLLLICRKCYKFTKRVGCGDFLRKRANDCLWWRNALGLEVWLQDLGGGVFFSVYTKIFYNLSPLGPTKLTGQLYGDLYIDSQGILRPKVTNVVI